MKKLLRTLPLLALLFMAVPHAYAGLSEGCYPAVECDTGEDYYVTSCQTHIESLTGPGTPSCQSLLGAPAVGYSWTFSCTGGCQQSLIPLCTTATANTSSALPCCPDGQAPVKDAASATGWKCSTDVYIKSGKVGIGNATPAAYLDVLNTSGPGILAAFSGTFGAPEVFQGRYTTTNRSYEGALGVVGVDGVFAAGLFQGTGGGSPATQVQLGTNSNALEVRAGSMDVQTKALNSIGPFIIEDTAVTIGDAANDATALYSIATGSNTFAGANYATAMGRNTIATGDSSTAIGSGTTASGGASTAMGAASTATGTWSTAGGYHSDATDSYATAFGFNAQATGYSAVALGYAPTASGRMSVAMGDYVTAPCYVETVVGKFNLDASCAATTWTWTDPIFVVGNGENSGVKSNALTVLKNGNVGINEANPSAALEIKRADGTEGLSIMSLSAGNTHLPFTDNWNYISGNGVIFRDTAMTEKMRFSASSGRLGIGDTTPDYPLDVVGNANVEGILYAERVSTSSTGIAIDGFGATMGGRFDDSNATGYAEIAYGDWGVRAGGSTGGAYFYNDIGDNSEVTLAGNGGASINADGYANLNAGSSGVALRVTGDEALWYDGNTYSWGWDGTANIFGDKVLIGGNWITGYMLEVNGSAAKPGGGSWTASSDIRLKDVHGDYDRGLEEILKLNPVEYNYKKNNPQHLPSDKTYVGFIGQDVQPVFPEAIAEGSDGYLQFDMNPINVAVINAVQELKTENDELKAVVCEIKPEAKFCAQ